MNRWAAHLAQTPSTLQRLIASSQRISLPRACTPAERLARLRAALCRPAAVRATYFALEPAAQQAVQLLRRIPRGLAERELTARFGPLRPLAELRADRAPRSLSERLLLLGWLLPRPATRNHPTRYLLPPELRHWLPTPLPAPDAPVPATEQSLVDLPALRAATAILAAAAAAPLPLRGDARPSVAALRSLRPRLAPLPAAEADALCSWLLPLLIELGLLAPHGTAVVPAPAAARFLADPLSERRRTLRDAWVRSPRPDHWLTPLRVNTRGLDWPALRRRLLAWAAALPLETTDPAAAHDLLHGALGPLADPVTHGFTVSPRRSPWLPRRAAVVWAVACVGPLAWLGEVGIPVEPPWLTGGPDTLEPHPGGEDEGEPAHTTQFGEDLKPAPSEPGASVFQAAPVMTDRWRYSVDGTLEVPHGRNEADLLTLAPFAAFVQSAGGSDSYRLSAQSIAAACARGHDSARLRALLLRRCEVLPTELEALLTPSGGLRLCAQTLLLSDAPADLECALRRRSVRRAVSTQLAPGVALVAPGSEAALVRALARDGRAVTPPPIQDTAPPAELSAGEAAALLLAAAFYRVTAPAEAPVGLTFELLDRLRAALPPALAAATEAAVAALSVQSEPETMPPSAMPSAPTEPAPPASEPPAPPPLAELLERLRTVLRRRELVGLRYQGADDAYPRERTVRPLRLERHGPWWYLHAYCLATRAERCFRLDRVLALMDKQASGSARTTADTAGQPRSTRRSAPQRPRSSPRAGFFAGPPDPAPGSPLVRVWLDECSDEPVARLGAELTDTLDGDALNRGGIERVVAHTVGRGVDRGEHFAPEGSEFLAIQAAREHTALHP